ncbi:MAG TPA: hypothetical protein VGM37_20810 [Armatimonadota bacterium]|jgi:hypothetical protein
MMFPVHIVAAVNKTADATVAQQAVARAHLLAQEGLADRESARLERGREQVSASAPEDRLELSSEGEGMGADGDDSGREPADEDDPNDAAPPDEGHINFLA